MTDIQSHLQHTLTGSYTFERELGGGGMSRVFLAEETRLGRKVVVKVLSHELAAGLSAERFEREIKLAASLQQANIVPVLSVGDADGMPFYTMPFVEGESLRARLGRGPLAIGEVASILRDVARALAYAHERGIVHRDIKPDNVLLSGGTAVVTDFGIAKAISASRMEASGATLTQLGTAIGTPAYISPEQAAGDPDVDHRADIYSFGCMAFELLTGEGVFATRTPQRLIAAHLSEPPRSVLDLRPDTPPALATLVMACLEKEPDRRPSSANELLGMLASVPTESAPHILLGGKGMLKKALAAYAVAFIFVAVVAKAAIVSIGLPDWVFPGALVVMALGLPVILFTAYAQFVARRAAAATPTFTPGGTPSLAIYGTMATLALKASPHVSWRRAVVGGVWAVGAFAIAIGAFMALRALGIGPAGTLLASGAIAKRSQILVTDFKSSGPDSSLGNVVTEAVRADLGQSNAISVVQPVAIVAALQRMQLPPDTRVDLRTAGDIAEREGIAAIVDGEIAPLGAGYLISVKLVRADSGTELTSFRTVVGSPTELIDGINKVARQLRGKIGESLKSVQASPPLARVTTHSLDALRKFTEASRANLQSDYARSVSLYRDAVAFDSAFATAWLAMSVAMVNGRGYPQSQQDSAITMAFRFLDRLPAGARRAVSARYYNSGPGRDPRRALALYEELFAADSNPGTANSMALILGRLGEYARAESTFRWVMQRAPDMTFPYGNIVMPQIALGKFSDAEASVALARARHPTYLTAVLQQGMLLYHKGDLAGYRKSLDSLRATRVPRLRTTSTYSTADLSLLEGRLRDFTRYLGEARAMDAAVGAGVSPLIDSIAIATNEAWFLERPQDAAKRLDDAVARYPLNTLAFADRPYVTLASAYALAGRPDRARDIIRQFEAAADTTARRAWTPGIDGAMGDIAIAEGKPRDAIPLLRRSAEWQMRAFARDPSLVFARVGRAFDLAHESDSAIVYFQRFLDTPSYERLATPVDPMYRAAVYKRLGELYEAKGDKANAATNYSKFIDLWKNADAELQPKVAAVRSRLARLGDAETRR